MRRRDIWTARKARIISALPKRRSVPFMYAGNPSRKVFRIVDLRALKKEKCANAQTGHPSCYVANLNKPGATRR